MLTAIMRYFTFTIFIEGKFILIEENDGSWSKLLNILWLLLFFMMVHVKR